MQIVCSGCNSEYALSLKKINGLNQSILSCKECQRYIKITFCPHCGSFYSITFSQANHDKYKFMCKRCKKTFIVEFPAINEPIELKKQIAPKVKERSLVYERQDEFEIKERYRSRGKTVPVRKEPVRAEQETRVVFRGETFKEFSLKELFSICLTSLRKMKLFIAGIGVTSFLLVMYFFSKMESLLFPISGSPGEQNFPLFFNLVPALLLLFVFFLIAALISRITLEEIFYQSRWSLSQSVRFSMRIAPQVIVSNIFVLILGNLILILFGKIPFVGPIFYSVLFLPIYISSMLFLLALSIGFWFYAPIVAYREIGIIRNVQHLYHFIKRHNFTLIYIIPIMILVSSVIFFAAYLLHVGALSLTIILSRGVLNEDLGRLFSAMPAGFLQIADLSTMGSELTIFRSLLENLIFSHQLGGFIIGIVLVGLSILLFSVFMSLTATLSTHVYIMLERNRELADRKKVSLLLVLVLILIGLSLVRKMF